MIHLKYNNYILAKYFINRFNHEKNWTMFPTTVSWDLNFLWRMIIGDCGVNSQKLLTSRGRTRSLTHQPTVYLLYCQSYFSSLVSRTYRCWIRHQVEQRNHTALRRWLNEIGPLGRSVRWSFVIRDCAFIPRIAISKFERSFCITLTIRPPYSSRAEKETRASSFRTSVLSFFPSRDDKYDRVTYCIFRIARFTWKLGRYIHEANRVPQIKRSVCIPLGVSWNYTRNKLNSWNFLLDNRA